jgi:hypothetical protein
VEDKTRDRPENDVHPLLRAFFERHGDDDFSGWHETDVDPRKHRSSDTDEEEE